MYRALFICLLLASTAQVRAQNTVIVTSPEYTTIVSEQSPHIDDGSVWSGFAGAEWIVQFIEVRAAYAMPPIQIFGRSGLLAPGFTLSRSNDSGGGRMYNFAQLIEGDISDFTLYTDYRGGINSSGTNTGNTRVYQAGLRIPLSIYYHPEPDATATVATVRIYINGGLAIAIDDDYNPAQFDLKLAVTPPAYDSEEFALTALPASPIAAPTATPISGSGAYAALTLSGTAASEHAEQRVFVRYRAVNLRNAKWSALAPLATVSENGTWSGTLPLPTAQELEIDLILSSASGTQYRQHVASTQLISLEDTEHGDFAEDGTDLVPNLFKRATGIATSTPIGGTSSLTQITPVTLGDDTYMAITYQVDPSQVDIEVVPEWSPDYRVAPFRFGGIVRELQATDESTGIQTWRARAPYSGDAYMRLNIRKTTH